MCKINKNPSKTENSSSGHKGPVRPDLSPIVVVRRQHHTRAGVGVAGDPGAVDGKHHEQHEHEHGDDGLDVGAEALLCLLLLRHVFAHLPGLPGRSGGKGYWSSIGTCSLFR